jgi:hypothetical protein
LGSGRDKGIGRHVSAYLIDNADFSLADGQPKVIVPAPPGRVIRGEKAWRVLLA